MNIGTIKELLDEYFLVEERQLKEIFNQLTLYIYAKESKQNNSDLYMLAKILPDNYLNALIRYYDGDILKTPTKEEFLQSYLLAFCFFLKEIQGWTWEEIKKFFPTTLAYENLISSISIGRKINNIKEDIDKGLLDLLFKYRDTMKNKKEEK
jgi:hypothetical protein